MRGLADWNRREHAMALGGCKFLALMKSTNVNSVSVGFFKNCRVTHGGTNRPLSEILSDIKEGKWAKPIAQLRRLDYGSKPYDAQKGQLACFMLSASTATGGHKAIDIAEHTGLLQLDVDELGEDAARSLRDQLGNDPHIYASWLSPGGKGVKAALRISASVEGHKRAFAAAENYLRERYAIQIDQQCKDTCRLCFVSHDPDLRINGRAILLPVPDQVAVTAGLPAAGKLGLDSSPSLHASCSIAILHNNLFDEFPGLKQFYSREVILRIGTPQKGTRNAALVEMISRLFYVVHPRFVLAFAEIFYEHHATGIFADYPKEKFLSQARDILGGCLASYPSRELAPNEAELYARMGDDSDVRKAAFRISRSLAFCTSDPALPPPIFALSAEKLGYRLGILDMEAWRIQRKMEKLGIIREISKGKRRAKGEEPEASKYVWVPEQKVLPSAS